jgi:hypothetical protein
MKALCVVPFGMEEGTTAEISGKAVDLCVWTGEPAEFRFLSSTTRRKDRAGELCDVKADMFVEHEPIETALPTGGAEPRAAEVDLRAHLTEIGVLELSCIERGKPDQAWRLEFNVRHGSG